MLVGRNKESRILLEAFHAEESQFVAVYGRRRVGKTYLIRQILQEYFVFQHAGMANSPMHVQLQAWRQSLIEAGADVGVIKNWMDAFSALKQLIKNSKQEKKVIFLQIHLMDIFFQICNLSHFNFPLKRL